MKYFCFFLLVMTPLLGSDHTLSSSLASYNGNTLILEESVQVHHALGTLSAEKAFLERGEETAESPFTEIKLQERVKIVLQQHQKLLCEQAELDFLALQGKLTALPGEKVEYFDLLKEKQTDRAPLHIASQTIDFSFLKEGSIYLLDTLKARSQVQITYRDSFLLEADEASYTTKDSSHLLSAYPKAPNKHCSLVYEKNVMEMDLIEINTRENTLRLYRPQGTLSSHVFSPHHDTSLSLSCNRLTWDHYQNILTLEENILLQESHFGSLRATHKARIEQAKDQETIGVRTIDIEGESLLSHEHMTLRCFGSLHVEGAKGQITALSPRQEGIVLPTEQIVYANEDLSLQADQAFLEYTDPSYTLSFIVLKGNVRIQTKDLQQCGIADRLTHTPETETTILSASQGKKVLFFDQEQKVLMTAQEVHLTRNPDTNRLEARGVGNVKLCLSSEEGLLLQEKFPQLIIPQVFYESK